ncbi:flippase [Bacillus sp. B1-b2]|uniref:flippase n=1 Tax=Bacillus sp. B1-b2 TaxID=2653201 RepID=UPI001261FD02|nr:flippase [Bacillus sp. B1-b2]KAB7671692.1 flippase [Bacillus sp. B1-b2]
MANKEKSIKINIALNLTRNIMKILFPLISFPYVSRVLGADGLGKVSFAQSFIGFFTLFAGLGIFAYAIREGSKLKNDKEKLGKFSTEMVIINTVSSVVTYIAFFSILFIPALMDDRTILIVFSMTIAFNVIGIEWLYNILEEYKYITIRAIAFQVISIISMFLFVKTKDDFLIYASIIVVASVGSNILNLINSRKLVKLFGYNNYNFKQHFKPIFIIFGTSIASSVYLNSDITMLSLMKGDTATGLYTVATKIKIILVTLISSLVAVLLPRLSYYAKTGKVNEYNELFKKGFNLILLISFPCFVGMFMLSENLINILSGNGYNDAIVTMKILSFTLVLSAINGIIAYHLLLPFNHERSTLIATTLGCIVNLLLNAIFIPIYSQNAAAFTTILAEFCVLIYCLRPATKIVNLSNLFGNLYQYLIASSSIVLVSYLVRRLFSNDILVFLITFIASFAIYFLILLILKNDLVIYGKNFLYRKIKKQLV